MSIVESLMIMYSAYPDLVTPAKSPLRDLVIGVEESGRGATGFNSNPTPGYTISQLTLRGVPRSSSGISEMMHLIFKRPPTLQSFFSVSSNSWKVFLCNSNCSCLNSLVGNEFDFRDF